MYYGKLPAFGDFVRYNAAGPEFRAFDTWLQEGIYMSRKRLPPMNDPPVDNRQVYYFCMYFTDSPNYITGLLKPSRDKVGRKYPFIVAHIAHESTIRPDSRPVLPVMYRSFYREADAFAERAASETASGALAEGLHHLESYTSFDGEALEEYNSYLRTTTINNFFTSLWGNDSSDKQPLLMKNFREVRRSIAGRPTQTAGFGFRFPLQTGPAGSFITESLWIESFFSMLNTRNMRPFVFWETHSPSLPSNLFLFLRLPSPDVWTHMIHPEVTGDLIFRMDTDNFPGGSSASDTFSPHHYGGIISGDASLEMLLQKVITV
jgi:type VI secretion system ImpM family protein